MQSRLRNFLAPSISWEVKEDNPSDYHRGGR